MNAYELEQLRSQVNRNSINDIEMTRSIKHLIESNQEMIKRIKQLNAQVEWLSRRVDSLSMQTKESNVIQVAPAATVTSPSRVAPAATVTSPSRVVALAPPFTEEAALRIPKPFGLNPVADLNNYCTTHLKVKPEYRHTTLFSAGPHKIEVWLGNYKLAEYTDPQKQKAKNISASIGLGELNRFRDNLDQLAKDIYA